MFALIGMGALYFLGRKGGKESESAEEQSGGAVAACESAMDDGSCAQIGLGLRNFFEESYLLPFSDYSQLDALCTQILDGCGARKVSLEFGVYETFYGKGGGLSFWLSKLPEDVKNRVRPHFHQSIIF